MICLTSSSSYRISKAPQAPSPGLFRRAKAAPARSGGGDEPRRVVIDERPILRRRFRVLRPAQRSGRREHLAGLEQRLETGEDHRPAAVELVVGVLAQLIVGDG